MPRRRVSLLCVLASTALGGAPAVDSPALQDEAPAEGAGEVAPADVLPLPFHYDLYTFRGEGRRTAVVAAFSVSAGLLRQEESGKGVRYRFDVTLVLADTARRSVSRTDDSVFVRFPRPLLAEHLLYTQLELQVSPSRSTVQRVIMTDATVPGIGQLYGSSFPIPDYSGSRLMLSDIALGLPDARAGWKRGDVTLALLPTSQFPESAFDVYYEIYNLPAGRWYVTEIAVEAVRPGARAPVRLRFTGPATPSSAGLVQELRRVETSLAAGRHRITVTVTDPASGQSASSSRVFEVRGWPRGATLVAALPRAR